ncbi:MAG: hypothetical protein HYS17_01220 [Micavibrio aeruginosavorus]|uniref:Flagellin C-terminal domain-containing protein n=1 Tax=Micavibrio aeruginosavorus TaxID=349221 RepID=A0A7T5UHY3_9BACT|nr:MAG: hypothetical protein HYS17_01220 [Micavibrio aeruginosavorus]
MTFVSTIGQSLDQVERLKILQSQLGTLQTQLTTGKKTELFKGLGSDVITSKKSRASFNALDNYLTNIETANRRMSMTTNIIEEVKAQSEGLLGSLELQTQEGEYEIEALGQYADNLQGFIANLLNEKDGDRYLLGGANTLDKPLTDTGGLDTYSLNQIEDWVNGVITTDQFIQSYRDKTQLTDTIVGYSAEIASGETKAVTVRVDDNAEIDYTVMANADPFRNIMIAISMVKNIDAVLDEVTLEANDPPGTVTAPGANQEEQNENFYRVFNDLAAMLNKALDQIDTERFKLAQAQAQTAQIADNHKFEKNMLATAIADVEDVDINEVAVRLNALTVQLEASYRVTATISNLNLATFLA